MRRRAFLALSVAAAAGAALMGRAFSRDLAAARQRLVGRSRLVHTRFGQMEVAEDGDGPPVLMVHGTGGGFDQALTMAAPLVGHGWRLIAPSRIGYLRSDYPPGATPATEADGLADLLDALGIDRVPVIGGSAGAQPAIEFAIRHPDRCSALVALVPAAHAPGRPPVRPPTPLAQAIIDHGLRSDFLFWAGMHVAPDAMIGALLATDPALVHAAAARHIAASVKGAELILYPTGGHIWIGRQQQLFAAADDFLRRAAKQKGRP